MKYVIKKKGKYWPSYSMKKIAWIKNNNIYKEAEKAPIKFWENLAEEGLNWEKKWKRPYEEKLPYFKWFVNGKLNFCYNCVDRHLFKKANKTALIWIPEPINEKPIKLTYKELYEKVCKLSNVLKKYNIKKGDVITIYLPLIPEALIAMLACTRIGAIHSVVFSAFSADALKSRIEDGKAKLLITADGYYRRGEKENLLKKAKKAVKGTSIKKVLVVPRIKKKFYSNKYKDFNKEMEKAEKTCKPVTVNSEDIMFILYTSGCCHGNSLIQLANGEVSKIRELVENNIKPKIINVHSSPFVQANDTITNLHRYPNNSELYKIRTPSFEATFTPNHIVFSLDENCNLIEKKVSSLRENNRIFVVSEIEINGKKQILPLLKQKENYYNKTTYRPSNLPQIPTCLTEGFAQILGYFAGDGHLDKRSVILTDKNKNNLIFYKDLIERELKLKGIIKKIDRQRLLVNSSIFREYMKKFFPEIVCRSRNRSVPKIIQKSENGCVARFLKGLFDAEGTIGHSFIKLSVTSENLVRISQLLLRRFGILAKVYPGISKERKIGSNKIKETQFLDIIISERESLNKFNEKISFSHETKRLKLNELMKKLSLKKVFPKERFPIFSLLKEITKTIKVNLRGEFKKILQYMYSNQIDRNGLKLVKELLDKKIKIETDEKKLKKLKSIRYKIQELMEFKGIVLEKVLKIDKIDNEYDFVYDLTTKNNHNYIVDGILTHNTTGKPKGIVHDTGGYAVQAYWTSKWNFNLHNKDIIWCTADIGWITGHTYAFYGPLLNGATTLIYEGSPDFPKPDRWWKIIKENKVSVLYTAPTAIRMFMKFGDEFVDKYKMNSLKILGTVGEPIDEDAWKWYFKKIGKSRCPVIDTWWQTETGGALINSLPGIGPFVPTVAGKSFPGTKHIVVDEQGREKEKGELGALVQKSPFAPGLLHGVYKNHKKYVETYWKFWKKFKKKYYDTSDGAFITKDGLIRITGRTDDVMKVAGHRLSTAELENAINEHKLINECAVVSIPDKIKGEVPVAFAVLGEGKGSEKLVKGIKKHVDEKIGPIARPDKIYFVKDLPKTRSGKIMRRILKNILNKEEPEGLMTLVNPEIVKEIRSFVEYENK